MTLSKLDEGLGAQLVGILVSSLLFGVTVMQVHTFFMTTSPQELLLLFVVAFVMYVSPTIVAEARTHSAYLGFQRSSTPLRLGPGSTTSPSITSATWPP
jgi:hypothetical protein